MDHQSEIKQVGPFDEVHQLRKVDAHDDIVGSKGAELIEASFAKPAKTSRGSNRQAEVVQHLKASANET